MFNTCNEHKDKDNKIFEHAKVFFFIYDFDKKVIENEANNDWRKNHLSKKENLKNFNDKDSLEDSRKWYKEQLYKIDFDNLTEKEKSDFIKETLIAFGNVPKTKSDYFQGTKKELKDSLKLARFYNVHLIPYKYIYKPGKEIFNLARQTFLHWLIEKEPFDKKEIDEISAKKTKSIALLKDLYKKNAPKFDKNWLLTQEKSVPLQDESPFEKSQCEQMDNVPTSDIVECIKRYNLEKLLLSNSQESALKFINNLKNCTKELLNKLINKEDKEKLKNDVELFKRENNIKFDIYDFLPIQLNNVIGLSKSSYSIICNYDCLNDFRKYIDQELLKKFLTPDIFLPQK